MSEGVKFIIHQTWRWLWFMMTSPLGFVSIILGFLYSALAYVLPKFGYPATPTHILGLLGWLGQTTAFVSAGLWFKSNETERRLSDLKPQYEERLKVELDRQRVELANKAQITAASIEQSAKSLLAHAEHIASTQNDDLVLVPKQLMGIANSICHACGINVAEMAKDNSEVVVALNSIVIHAAEQEQVLSSAITELQNAPTGTIPRDAVIKMLQAYRGEMSGIIERAADAEAAASESNSDDDITRRPKDAVCECPECGKTTALKIGNWHNAGATPQCNHCGKRFHANFVGGVVKATRFGAHISESVIEQTVRCRCSKCGSTFSSRRNQGTVQKPCWKCHAWLEVDTESGTTNILAENDAIEGRLKHGQLICPLCGTGEPLPQSNIGGTIRGACDKHRALVWAESNATLMANENK